MTERDRCAYAAIQKGLQFIVIICREREAGYRVVPDYGPYDDKARAEGVAERLNTRLGISKASARKIVFSTMPKGAK